MEASWVVGGVKEGFHWLEMTSSLMLCVDVKDHLYGWLVSCHLFEDK